MNHRPTIYTKYLLVQKQLEDTKGVIRNRKSKKDRQHNEQKDKQQSTKQLGFMMLNAVSTIFELYRDSQVYWRGKAQ
jgi:hypothetical protein